MKCPNITRYALAALSAGSLALATAQAENVLWNLTFDSLSPGAPLEAAKGGADSDSPQKVATDDQNTLTGAKDLGDLKKSPLVFKKGSNSSYLPNFELISREELTSGIITIEWEFVVDQLSFNAQNREGVALNTESLLTFGVYTTPGKALYRITVLGHPGDQVSLNSEGLTDSTHDRGPKPAPFSIGEIMKVRMVLNLGEGSLEVFVNDEPYSDKLKDEKFTTFSGFRVGEGSAVGGNYGSTYVAGIDNIKITEK